jgi:hypothetical protein
MRTAGKILRGVGAIAVSGIISVIRFMIFGAVLPFQIMIWRYGRQEVQESPGHGSAIFCHLVRGWYLFPVAVYRPGCISISAVFAEGVADGTFLLAVSDTVAPLSTCPPSPV